MWIASVDGFFSVVQAEDDATRVVVRARVRADLAELRRRWIPTLGRISATPWRDYQYRCVVPKVEFAAGLAKAIIEGLTYNNYKMAVGERDPRRAQVLGRVWSVLRDLHRGDEPHRDDGLDHAAGVPLRDGTER